MTTSPITTSIIRSVDVLSVCSSVSVCGTECTCGMYKGLYINILIGLVP